MDHTQQPCPDTPDVTDGLISPHFFNNHTTLPPIREQDVTDDDSVDHIIEDVVECNAKKKEIYDTYFYKVVLGGHTNTIKRVLQSMETNGQYQQINWLLATKTMDRNIFYKRFKEKNSLSCAQYMVVLLTLFCSVIFCPVFYAVHGITCALFKQSPRKFIRKIRLPMVFAALSHSKDMMDLLISKNVHMEQHDKHGNNIFHYIADFSVKSSKSACKAFEMVLEFIPQHRDTLYRMLFIEKNSQGLTPLEIVAAFGSSALMTSMMNAEPNMINARFAVTSKGVIFPKENPHIRQGNKKDKPCRESLLEAIEMAKDKKIDEHNRARAASTKVEFIDVSMYESQDLAKRSFLLRLISAQNVSGFSVKELNLFQKCPVVGKWIKMKVREMKKYIYMIHALDIMITFMMISLLILLRQSVNLNVQLKTNKLAVQVQEINARQHNESSILKMDAYYQTMNEQVLDQQIKWAFTEFKDDEIKTIMLDEGLISNTTSENAAEIVSDMDITRKKLLVQKVIFKVGDTPTTIGLQRIPFLVHEYSKTIIFHSPDLPQKNIRKNYDDIEKLLTSEYKRFSVNISGTLVKPIDVFTYKEWQDLYCLPLRNQSADDFLDSPSIQPPQGTVADICMWKLLVSMAEDTCEPDTPREVYKKWQSLSSKHTKTQMAADTLFIVLIIAAVLYVVVDIYEHVVFFYLCIMANETLQEMFLSILSWRIPGSYYKKQLNIITYSVIIWHAFSSTDLISCSISALLLDKFTHYLLLIALILRFIMHIHALRLLPWIGHFVVTTFMMATNLIHFSTILGVVICIFALILHLLVIDINCPIRQHEGFETIGASLLSVFMLTFGHGDFDQYTVTIPVIVTYVLFVIICALLLLNLIIAIMSATATELMTPEGKQTLKMIEWLYEALSVEYTVAAVAGTKYVQLLYRDREHSGFVIENNGKYPRVLIKVFYCPKLD